MFGRKSRRYECRFVDKQNRQVASIWMDCPGDNTAVAEAAAGAELFRSEQMVGYVLRRGFRKIVSVSW